MDVRRVRGHSRHRYQIRARSIRGKHTTCNDVSRVSQDAIEVRSNEREQANKVWRTMTRHLAPTNLMFGRRGV